MPDTLSPSTALDFLPPNIAALPLYQWLGPLIDYALLPGAGIDTTDVDPLVAEMGLAFQDAEAVNAYVNLFVRPILGTRRVLDYVFALLDIQPTLDEWFPDPTLGLTPFHFQLTFETAPRALNLPGLIRLVTALKNERSHLLALRTRECADELTLDMDCEVDRYYLDSLEGYVDPVSGVIVCIDDGAVQAVQGSAGVVAAPRTSQTAALVYAMANALLDFTGLDEDTTLDSGSIEIAQGSTSERAAQVHHESPSFSLLTGLAQPDFTGRTSDTAAAVAAPPILPYQQRTSDTVQNVAHAITPTVPDIVSQRFNTAAIAANQFARQRPWDAVYDTTIDESGVRANPGSGMAWRYGLTWISDQPQAYSTRTSTTLVNYIGLNVQLADAVPTSSADFTNPENSANVAALGI